MSLEEKKYWSHFLRNILRNGDSGEPVLIDFGKSSLTTSEDEELEEIEKLRDLYILFKLHEVTL